MYRTMRYIFQTIFQGVPVEDVTIIGAGIGGTYTGWRLRNAGLRIGIYEFSDRVGGRMYSRFFPDAPDIPVDFGAMRIISARHPRMIKAGVDLGLKFAIFPEGLGRIPERTLLYLRNTHLTTNELGGPNTPYNLRPEERMDPRLLSQYFDYSFTQIIICSILIIAKLISNRLIVLL